METVDRIKELDVEIKVIKIIIEYLSSQLARYRVKLKNRKEEIRVCQSLVKTQKEN